MDPQSGSSAQRPDPVIIHKNNNVPLVSAILFLALVIGAAAVYLGGKDIKDTGELSPTATPTAANPTQTLSPTLHQTEELNWESYVSAKMKGLSFSGYSLSYPFEWTQKEERNDIASTLTLTKDGNEVKIYQAPTGGNMCVFEGALPEGPAADYRTKKFTDVKIENLTLRRVETGQGKIVYTFCSNSTNSKDTFGSPTFIGHITYTLTKDDPAVLTEMDKILSTIKIQE